MKTVTGRVNNAKPISLAKAATLLSGFVSSETEASQDVSAYLRRASAGFIELKSVHREIRSANPNSEARHTKEELGRAKGIDDSVENETVTGEESVHGRKQDTKKKRKEKKNRKSDGEIGSEERKSKKMRKSKETDA